MKSALSCTTGVAAKKQLAECAEGKVVSYDFRRIQCLFRFKTLNQNSPNPISTLRSSISIRLKWARGLGQVRNRQLQTDHYPQITRDRVAGGANHYAMLEGVVASKIIAGILFVRQLVGAGA